MTSASPQGNMNPHKPTSRAPASDGAAAEAPEPHPQRSLWADVLNVARRGPCSLFERASAWRGPSRLRRRDEHGHADSRLFEGRDLRGCGM
jgi:hypothetical protein